MKLKKFLSLALAGALALSLAAPALAADEPWYAEAQAYVTEKGIMTGTDKGFEPDAAVTRATVFETLWKLEGKPTPKSAAVLTEGGTWTSDAASSAFLDVVGTWYDLSANWSAENGLALGDETGAFNGGRAITRAEMVTILHRCAQLEGLELPVVEPYVADPVILKYDCYVPDWAVDAFYWALQSDVIRGIPGEQSIEYFPDKTLTRAELATVLMRFDRALAEAVDGRKTAAAGRAASISKYGNVTTDLPVGDFAAAGFEVGDIVTVTVGGQSVDAPYGTAYSNVDNGSVIVLPDSSAGTVAVAINMGSFAKTYGVEEGAEIGFAMGEKAGYLEEYEVRSIDALRTNDREDYSSDAVFANFRAVTLGGIAEGRLYRGSSPVNPELGRSAYADALLEENGVKAALNLADSEEVMESYEGFAETYYATIEVKCLDMGVDFAAEDFNAKLKEGLVWLSQQEGPYYVHCTEGKDRCGFVSALLECLCGAEREDVAADYMATYENYYHVEKGSDRWNYIAKSNIVKTLMTIAGVEDEEALAQADLALAAETYLVETAGLTETEVDALKDALCGK